MIQSMTGYGCSQGVYCGITYKVEIRTVNHRYRDTNIRLPEELTRLDQGVRNTILRRISRGRCDVSITRVDVSAKDIKPALNRSTILECRAILKELSKVFNMNFKLRDDLSLPDIIALKNLVTVPRRIYDSPGVGAAIMKIVNKSFDDLMKMRLREGRVIYKDLKQRINRLESIRRRIEQHVPVVIRGMKRRYIERMKELSGLTQLDMGRLYQELAIMVQRMDITEEIVRLSSHTAHFKSKLEDGAVVGRSLDFLLQEINREVNTIASKASDMKISQIAVDMKSEVERMREQVQNVE